MSNFTNHRTGHWYLSLKDESSVIRAVMFKGANSKISFVPKDGDKVLVSGRVGVFENSGQYQLYIENMQTFGKGDLHIEFEKLKKKLSDSGLFSQAHKLPIPKIPLTIGVITSPTGAAIRDILNILNRRFPLAKVVLYPALVQGENAYKSLINGVKYFDNNKNADVIIIGRGGGSIEDLWAFNNEELAVTIYNAKIPIISAVGHEIDFTICDFVSDLRAPTPSAAAELCVPSSMELSQKFDNLKNRLGSLINSKLTLNNEKLDLLKNSGALKNPMLYIDKKREQLDYSVNNLSKEMNMLIGKTENKFISLSAKLNSLSPLSVLSRGYAMTTKTVNGAANVIKSKSQLEVNDTLIVTFSDGDIKTTVTEI